MNARAQIEIKASKEAIWSIITDIDHSQEHIRGILKIEVLERPENGIIGLKWKEYREMFGKEATEIMWITEAQENVYYWTRAESHGSIYKTKLSIEPHGDNHILSMIFEGQALSFWAKVSNAIFSKMIRKSMEKALLEDLEDIKNTVEKL